MKKTVNGSVNGLDEIMTEREKTDNQKFKQFRIVIFEKRGPHQIEPTEVITGKFRCKHAAAHYAEEEIGKNYFSTTVFYAVIDMDGKFMDMD